MTSLTTEDLKALAELLRPRQTVEKTLDMRCIPKYTGKDSFLQWKYQWNLAVETYIPIDEEHPKQRERVFHSALFKCGEHDKDFIADVQTIIESGNSCEGVISCLETLYTPDFEEQRLDVVKKINNFQKTTKEGYKQLLIRFDRLLSEAKRLSYVVTDEMKQITLLNTLTLQERRILYLHSASLSSSESSGIKRMNYTTVRAAIESLALMDGMPDNEPLEERLEGAMTAVKVPQKSRKYEGRRTCQKCGRKAHRTDQPCPATDRECNHCSKTGHFATVVCPLKLTPATHPKTHTSTTPHVLRHTRIFRDVSP
eukprot:GHVR01102788.1.p1 GENE.GHVR01102788.1~~GHVR01102788.1.p1  ORF type:complete len:312 (+),score=19.01 GHVR01102788.1:148-1083(+)